VVISNVCKEVISASRPTTTHFDKIYIEDHKCEDKSVIIFLDWRLGTTMP